jgi:enolase-phosphatase E1
MRYILTDIEGTTTAVSFVYHTLFPYFKTHVARFLEESGDDPAIEELLAEAQETVSQEGGNTLDLADMGQQLIRWTDADRKHPALKALQGYVWRAGYLHGDLEGHIYPDVPPALERWKKAGIKMGVYSSGSVAAQKLLFSFSEFGDLTPYFSHYFDTQIGHKREVASYQAIAATIGIPAKDMLFLSDIGAELDAAAKAGWQTIQILRPGTEPQGQHRLAADFSEIK